MGVSKIVREIVRKVVGGLGWGRVIWGNGNGLSGVRGLVNWGVFGKWIGMGGEVWWEWVGEVWWLIDVWFVESLILSCCVNSG